ncbi:MAG TPA: MlaD family protein [Verrucomicrobiota bacterium]|nr:MlaD family protein [Verrucomicrobiota bacterium]
MNKSRLEWKVGLFVFVGLVLIALLLLQFSKGLTMFQPTYRILLQATDVGGLKRGAGVLMSGVQVGTVSEIRLAEDGKSVVLELKIRRVFLIHRDAVFAIEQSGFLGDQYVAIRPQANAGPTFQDGDRAMAQKPFNLQEFMGSSGEFINRIDQTVKKLDEAIENINRSVLSPETLTNLSLMVTNLRLASERAVSTLAHVDSLVESNRPVVSTMLSNFVVFSDQLNQAAADLNQFLASNTPPATRAVKNVESSTEVLKAVLSDVQAGKGMAGTLLQDEELATNVTQIAQNLSIASSNLNRLGLWGILWKPKAPRTNPPPAEILRAPKHPFP